MDEKVVNFDETRSKKLCEWVRDDGYRCRAPKERGRLYCLHHPPESVKDMQALAAKQNLQAPAGTPNTMAGLRDMTLDTYEDVVRWKRDIVILVGTGQMSATMAEQIHKLLTSLAQEMERRDKADPDKLSKRIFSAEAAIQAARKMTGEQAAKILLSGNFLDFLQTAGKTIDVTPTHAETIEEKEEVRREVFKQPPATIIQLKEQQQAESRVAKWKDKIMEITGGRDAKGEELEPNHRTENEPIRDSELQAPESDLEAFVRAVPRQQPEND